MIHKWIWAVMAACVLLAAGECSAATYYVATTGSDSNPGTSAAPFATLQKGVNAAGPGDTVLVGDGTYGCSGSGFGVTITKAGSSSAWITLQAQHPGAAILDAQLSCHSYIDLDSGSAYWAIKGFDIRNGYWGGIWANSAGAQNILIQGNIIHNIGNRSDSSVYGIVGVYTDASASNVHIDGNIIHDVGRTGGTITGTHDHGIYTHGSNMLITNNVFYNLLNGWHIQSADGFSGQILNNTFDGPGILSVAGQIVLWGGNSDVVIENNIFYNTRGVAVTDNYGGVTMSGSCSLSHNIVYSPGGSVGMIDSVPSACSQSSNQLNVNPLLVSPSVSSLNLNLQAGSPAIGAGLTLAQVPTDFTGATRKSPYDLGAYAYNTGTPTPVPPPTPAAPTVSITAPAAGATLSGAATVSGAASGGVGLASIGIAVDGGTYAPCTGTTAWSCSLNTASLTNASHTLTVQAKDTSGNAGTASVSVTVNNAAPPAPGCVVAGTSWQNTGFASQNAAFGASFDAIPNTASMDGVTGLSLGSATGFTSLAAIVRFNATGTIDARNGSAYAAATAIPYTVGSKYHVRLAVDPVAHTYSAYVTSPGGTEQTLGTGYAFRTEQASVASLNNWSLNADIGSHQVCNFALSAAPSPGPVAPPTVTISAPASGAALSGMAMVSGSASSSVGLASVALSVDGGSYITCSGTTGWSYSLNTATLSNGSHTLSIQAKDTAGNMGTASVTVTVSNAAAPPPTAGCTTAGTSWQNSGFASQSAAFGASFDAIPNSANMDGVTGLSMGSATGFTSLAAIVRFNSAGYIDARNGSAYAAAASIPYIAGSKYHVRLAISPAAHTYSAYVTPPGATEQTLGSNYAFRTEQAGASSLNNWSLNADVGTHQVCSFALAAAPAGTPPTVSISAPAAGASISGTATVSGTAASASGLASVAISVDGGTSAPCTGSTTWSCSLNTTSLSNASHSITVQAKDTYGNAGTAAVTVTVSNAAAPPPATGCATSGTSWQNSAFASQSGPFGVSFDAIPNTAKMDGVAGLSQSSATSFTSLAAIVRFNGTGTIDARNGSAYAAATAIPYSPGLTYHVRLAVTPATHTYSVYVTPPGGTELTLGTNYSFRTEQAAVSTLNDWSFYADIGTLQVCNFALH